MTCASRRVFAALPLAGLLFLPGCGKFFVDPNGLGNTTNCSTNCIYVANSGTDDVAALAATNPLSVVSSTNVSFGEVPNALAVTPNNAYLYASSAGGSLISMFAIQSDGSLAAAVTQVTGTQPYAMTVDSTGTYLLVGGLAVNSACSSDEQIALYVYTIGSGGSITNPSATPASGPCVASTTTGYPHAVAIAPNGNVIFVAAGTAGIAGYTFSGGVATPQDYLSYTALTGSSSVNGVVVDSSSTYVFAAASGTDGGVAQFSIPTTGSALPMVGSLQDSGAAMEAIADTTSYVYAADLNTGAVYGFSYSSGGLTALAGSPYQPSSTSSGTAAIATDAANGTVLTINSTSGPNLQEFTIGSNGALAAVSTISTSSGNYAPVALSVTQ